MKVDPRALEGIERKIARADEHLRTLNDEMSAWIEDGPNRGWAFDPKSEVHDDGRKHFYRIKFTRPIPIDWAVILGEAVHDLRSALDQAVYWLTVDWKREALKGSSFPVYTRKTPFREWSKKKGAWSSTSGMHKIRGIGPGPQAFIEALQPYPQRYRRPYCLGIWTLQNLWNQDKHRLVHLWGVRISGDELEMRENVSADCVVLSRDRRVLRDGAVFLRIACDPPHAHVEVRGQVSIGLSVRLGKGAGAHDIQLRDIYTTAIDVIRKLTNAIGHQDRPINLAVWTVKDEPLV